MSYLIIYLKFMKIVGRDIVTSVPFARCVRASRVSEKKYACQDAVSPAVQNVHRLTEIPAACRTRRIYRPFVAHLQEWKWQQSRCKVFI